MLTVKECRQVTPNQFQVVVYDDALPDHEGDLLLRRGYGFGDEAPLEVESFTIRARPEVVEAERINSTFLKVVPFGRWISVAVAATDDLDKGLDMDVWVDPNPAKYRPRVRPTTGAPDLGVVAAIYRVFLRTSDGSPAEEIARAFKVTSGQAHQWLMHARRQGYLGPIAPRKRRRPAWWPDED